MASLSVSAAAGAGFKLIGKRPLSVLAWGLFYVLVGVAPALAMFSAAAPNFMDVIRYASAHHGGRPLTEMISALQGQMLFAHPIVHLLSTVVKTMGCAAVFRAVLEPRKSSFAYLRLGMQEVWIFLVTLVEAILVGIGILVAILVSALIVGGLASAVSETAGAIAAAVLGVVVLVAACWVLLRLSMAQLISFDEREFRLFESWKLTRGHAWSLFLLALLLIVIAIAAELLFSAVLAVAAMASGVENMFTHDAIEAFMRQPPATLLRTVAPYLAVFGLVLAFLLGVTQAVFLAPWAAAYQMLKGEAAA